MKQRAAIDKKLYIKVKEKKQNANIFKARQAWWLTSVMPTMWEAAGRSGGSWFKASMDKEMRDPHLHK